MHMDSQADLLAELPVVSLLANVILLTIRNRRLTQEHG